MKNNQLSVEAIENGTVIDHIPAGLGLTILRQFKLLHYGNAVTVGFNLPSQSQGKKDIIKIKDVQFSEEDANRLALFSPNAVVNQIENFVVIKKMRLSLPESITEVFCCPNQNCASHSEPVVSRFHVHQQNGLVKLKCHYCEKTFAREAVTEA
ncbi:aspartate carbamoyltransferase regulatory subunit [Alysiella filiformis]|uniref:Aspartate carbamoyltransferase regulatory chain n=1 Tax=Alysiella filiformis DSM 16848 TaxID=1120981 RepID=A0A286EPF0_9NEIS|nr:aspartate carbamoyltransferase regulatory subunit [Alysiella filiformis]QMT31255.1 aspartate carbamoyltransferase regulatory subunit [Alysiella filiformis]UBQ55744.1 aspartate carbamoyltransferase regulatory subunit [Alysiella filiformis DSM 16848]SOD72776.1 aspartate carbamoyltransferase regulatory subunit [Alysiella filiformis DSM 16848]